MQADAGCGIALWGVAMTHFGNPMAAGTPSRGKNPSVTRDTLARSGSAPALDRLVVPPAYADVFLRTLPFVLAVRARSVCAASASG